MVEKCLKNCSTSLVIREMQIKTILRFYLTPVRMARIKTKTLGTENAGENVEKENTPPLLVVLQAGKTTLEISLVVPQKMGHNTT